MNPSPTGGGDRNGVIAVLSPSSRFDRLDAMVDECLAGHLLETVAVPNVTLPLLCQFLTGRVEPSDDGAEPVDFIAVVWSEPVLPDGQLMVAPAATIGPDQVIDQLRGRQRTARSSLAALLLRGCNSPIAARRWCQTLGGRLTVSGFDLPSNALADERRQPSVQTAVRRYLDNPVLAQWDGDTGP